MSATWNSRAGIVTYRAFHSRMVIFAPQMREEMSSKPLPPKKSAPTRCMYFEHSWESLHCSRFHVLKLLCSSARDIPSDQSFSQPDTMCAHRSS